jgi:hypothetical protein
MNEPTNPISTIEATLSSTPDVKPGYKTTEFWMTAAAALIGLLLASGVIPSDSGIDKALGMAAAALAAMGYTFARGMAKQSVKLLLLGIVLVGMAGCTTALKSDKIVSVKQRTFGIQIGASPSTQTPEIKLGLVTTVFQLIPTTTNGPIYSPKFFDTFEIGQSANPFNTSVRENTGSGDVQVTTNAQGSAIIPKIPAAMEVEGSRVQGSGQTTPAQ